MMSERKYSGEYRAWLLLLALHCLVSLVAASRCGLNSVASLIGRSSYDPHPTETKNKVR
jgi:hypothetical protein